MTIATDRQDRARRVRYLATLEALAVETNPRYRPYQQGPDDTYCNLFVADAAALLGALLPLYVLDGKGQQRWLGANEMQDWLYAEGPAQRWRVVAAAEAQQLANRGFPVVATWKKPHGIGHMAMVRPGPEPPGANGPLVAHAGAHNANQTDAATAFGGADRLAEVVYFAAIGPAP